MFKKLIALLKRIFGIKPPVVDPIPDPVIIPTDPPIVIPPIPDPVVVPPTPEPAIIPPVAEPEPTPPVIVPPVVIPPSEPTIETVGGGSGTLNLPNVSGQSIKIKPGTYNNINIGECTDSKIDATGVQMAKDGSVYFTKQASNTELYGIKWNGHYYRAIFIQAQMKKLYLHDLSFKDVNNYVISDEWSDLWDGTDKTAKTDWRVEDISFENCGTGFNGKSGIDVEGNKITGMFKNFKMKGITVKNCPNMGSLVWMGASDNYDISKVTIDGMNMNFPDKNAPNGPHNGIFSITGNGKLHEVICQNHQGNLIRGWNISFSKTPATTELYNNRIFKSWKYGAFELQTPPHLLQFLAKNKDKYTFANAKVYGNVAGKLNKAKDWDGQMLDLYTLGGGSVSYYDNIGFEMVASNPQYHPITNMINNMSEIKVVEYNNKYYATQKEAGVVIDDDPDPEPPKGRPVTETRPVKQPDPLPPAATIKQKGFPLGSTVKKSQIDDPKIQDIFKREFSIVTGEGVMNGKSMRKSKTTFDYTESDKIIAFAGKNKMKAFVNPLVWNVNDATYLAELEKDPKLTKTDWIAILKDYVQAPMLHNKKKFIDTGIIDRIDYVVVNEPFSENEDYPTKGELKDCVWLRKIGPEYLPFSFKFAGEADPKAFLFMNDYGQEYAYKKLDSMVKFAADCKKNKIPFHGYGLQFHLGTGWGYGPKDIENNMMKLVATGKMIHISELDVAINGVPDGFNPADYRDKMREQEALYVCVFKAAKKVPASQLYGVSTWGIIDPQSYNNRNSKGKNKDMPLLFDKNYKAKDVYNAILKVV